MEMFSKIKSAVSSALPGNPLSKDFEIYGHIASGGPGMMWKIFSGVKRTTKQDAAIFLFDKKCLEKLSRRDKDLVIEAMKKGVSQLTRLRHPKILSVIHPLEESRENLAFATEPVFASLANLLHNEENVPESVAQQLKEHKMYEVEIKYGLLQVTEALQFLHNDAKLFHSNICPQSIYVNKNGAWKLAGFDHCVPNKNPPEQAPHFPFKPWDPDTVPWAQPILDYMAPEFALSESCSLQSDMFSMGVLIHAVFNYGKPLYVCKDQWSTFRKNSEELRKFRGSLLGNVPTELQDIVKLLLNTEPTVRPDPDQLAKVKFFEDVGSITLQYMDSLFQQDNLQKSKFFKGLPKIIAKFPKRVNLQRMLPPLLKECVNPEMIPFVLPNILQIAEQATDKEFATLVLPDLIPMFKIVNPIQILLIFMQNMNLLLKKTPAPEVKSHVLPMIFRALESNNPQLQELCLNILPTFADMIDYSSLKNSIVPRIKKLCLSANTTGVCVNCLLCLGQLLEGMDKWFVIDEVLPLLPQIPSREPAVLMSILGIYRVALTHEKLGITKDLLAAKVLPFLIPLSVDHNLNLKQFNAYMGLIQEMLSKVQQEQRGKLEQLEQMKQEQKNLEISKVEDSDDKTLISGITDDRPKTMMDNFLSDFGLSKTSAGGAGSRASPSPSSLSEGTGQPAKVSMSLEEKQRLAKQQEQQRFLKSQKALKAQTSTASTPPKTKPTSSQPKDLTSSLMNANMMSLSNSASKPATSYNVGGLSNMNSTGAMSANRTSQSMHNSMGSVSSGMTSSSFGVSSSSTFPQNTFGGQSGNMSSSSTFPQNAFGGQSGGMGQQNKPVKKHYI